EEVVERPRALAHGGGRGRRLGQHFLGLHRRRNFTVRARAGARARARNSVRKTRKTVEPLSLMRADSARAIPIPTWTPEITGERARLSVPVLDAVGRLALLGALERLAGKVKAVEIDVSRISNPGTLAAASILEA